MFSGWVSRHHIAATEPVLPRTVLRPGDYGYDTARQNTNARLDFSPAAIAYCYTYEDVALCIQWAVAGNKPIAVRSGGHDYEGFSLNNGGIVIDLSRYRGIRVGARKNTAWVRAGTDLETLYHELAAIGRSVPGGTCPTVAVAGIATGGGYGMLVRRNGLLCDHLRRVRLVDAQGRVRDSARDPFGDDLLWACRGGGGGSFGVVTDLQFDLVAIPSHVLTFSVRWAWDAATFGVLLKRWMQLSGAPRELMSIFTVAAGGSRGMHCFGQFLGTESELQPIIDMLAERTSPTESRIDRVRFIDAIDGFAGKPAPRQSWKMKSSLGREPMGEAAIAAIVASVQAAGSSLTTVLEFDSLGGALSDVAETATAFPHRDACYSLQYQTYWPADGNGSEACEWIDRAFALIDPHTAGTSYRNYPDVDLPDWQRRYFGANYRRLQIIKAALDPENRFAFRQSIEPSAGE